MTRGPVDRGADDGAGDGAGDGDGTADVIAQAMVPAASTNPFGWRFVSPLLLGSALNPINSSMIATALVGIGTDLGVDAGKTAALISVLYLSSAVAQPTLGKVSTLLGPRRTFLGGLVVLLVAGLIGAFAPTFGVLLVSRALIGIGTSACYPTAMALIRQRADANGGGVPTSVLGNLTIAAQITATFGFPLGGVLVGAFGWRSIFVVNIPLAVLTFVLTLTGVPKDADRPREGRGQLITALDLPGIALFAGMITALLLFLSEIRTPIWWLLGVCVVLAAALLVWERRAASPLIDVRMLAKNLPLQRTYLRAGLVSLGNYSALLGMSQWLEQGRGLSAWTVGLILIPLSGAAAIISRIVSRRGWVRWALLVGGIMQGVAGLVMLTIGSTTSIVLLIGMTLLLGCYAFGSVGNQATLYLQSPPETIAVASGLFRTSTYVGAIFSSSILAVAFGTHASDGGIHNLGWALVGIGVLIAALVVFDRKIPRTANP
ncbi:MFS transporter [Plantibacter sp. YIM 135249]|uniref:MFS transporter n=1 Tax=Plantibacter sp. YIM 135249 TaxID=3423918 RepID=UPI003D332665